MPARVAPTARQQRIGLELRRMREAAGLNSGQAAQRLGVDRTRISNTEAGRAGVSAESVRTLASVYRCTDPAYVDALAAMAEERGKGWWEEYRGKLGVAALDLAELEHHARAIKAVQVAHMPGLLQTEEYTTALFSTAVPRHPAVQLRRGLSFRMKRRDVLDADDPPRCTFLIHELALRLDFGGPTVMAAQLARVLEASERPGVTVRAIPIAAGGFPEAGSSLTYVCGPVPQLDTVVYDAPEGARFLDAPAVLERYRSILSSIESIALSTGDTRDFVRNLIKRL